MSSRQVSRTAERLLTKADIVKTEDRQDEFVNI